MSVYGASGTLRQVKRWIRHIGQRGQFQVMAILKQSFLCGFDDSATG
jgi:hypothetical protein